MLKAVAFSAEHDAKPPGPAGYTFVQIIDDADVHTFALPDKVALALAHDIIATQIKNQLACVECEGQLTRDEVAKPSHCGHGRNCDRCAVELG